MIRTSALPHFRTSARPHSRTSALLRAGYTLIELLVVVSIMGFMATVSIGAYHAMQRGMEERGVMQTVDQFIRNAYARVSIDRQPVAVYFWNETRSEDSDDTSLKVVGRAVAVRRAGRVTYCGNNLIADEFSDLRVYRARDEDGDTKDGTGDSGKGSGKYLYKINGNESSFRRWRVSATTVRASVQSVTPMLASPDLMADGDADNLEVSAYGYYFPDGGSGDWKVGDAYALEFAELTLPDNFIFGSSYKQTVSDPIQEVSTVFNFRPSGSPSGNITVYALRPGKTGVLEPGKVGTSANADSSVIK